MFDDDMYLHQHIILFVIKFVLKVAN